MTAEDCGERENGHSAAVGVAPGMYQTDGAVRLFAKWNKTQIDHSMITDLGIQELAKNQYAELSTGQKRRLHPALP